MCAGASPWRSISAVMATRSRRRWANGQPSGSSCAAISARPSRARAAGPAVVADEEALPFAPQSFDLVLSAMALHWVNDLPGTLIQIGRILKPDGLFLGAMLGGGTLWQLRQALAAAESEIEGGLSPRVSPFADLRDAAGLLQRAGFALPVADGETIDVEYESALALMRDLGAMGEGNLVRRAPPRAGAPRHVAARGGNLRRALRRPIRPGDGELRGAVPARLGAACLAAQAAEAGQCRASAGRGAGRCRAQRRRKSGAELDRAWSNCRSATCCRRASASSSPTSASSSISSRSPGSSRSPSA